MRRQATSIALLTLALGACSDGLEGPDVLGVWRVTAHTDNTAGCSAGPAVTDPPFIQFTKEKFFGVEYLTYGPCSDATTCEPDGFGHIFATPITDGYASESYSAFRGSGPDCALGAALSQLVVSGGTMAIKNRSYGMTEALTADQCTSDAAKQRYQAGTLPCLSFESLTTVRN